MVVSLNGGTPKSSILIGISIIFTIHFGGNTPLFGNIHLCFTWVAEIRLWTLHDGRFARALPGGGSISALAFSTAGAAKIASATQFLGFEQNGI